MLKKLDLNYKFCKFFLFSSLVLVVLFFGIGFWVNSINIFAKETKNPELMLSTNIKTNLESLESLINQQFIVKFANLGFNFLQKPKPFVDFQEKNIFTIDLEQKTEILYVPELFIRIPAINLETNKISNGSMQDIPKINDQLLHNPVMENQLASQVCSKQGNSYLMGHSELSGYSEKDYKGILVFANLENLNSGDEIIFENQNQEIVCKYKLLKVDTLITDFNNKVTQEELNFALKPSNLPTNTLTIQTCQKGSSTVRLLFRAELIE